MTKPLLRVLAGETLEPPPWWLMRQAGRYLSEYRATRETAGDFIRLCLTPELAAEVTLQPVRRFGMDAAILFSDILLVPRALGQPASYEAAGLRLEPLSDGGQLGAAEMGILQPVGEAAARVARNLPDQTALIGFPGAPWTVATYMAEDGTSRDFHRVKQWAYGDPSRFSALIDRMTAATFDFLALQIAGGVEVVQLFDWWAGALSPEGFDRWVIAPTRQLVTALEARFPHVSVIGFPCGTHLSYERYTMKTGVDALGFDAAVPPDFRSRKTAIASAGPGQPPVMLLVGGAPMREEVLRLRSLLGSGPYIFNRRHGILPQTSPDHVAAVARLLRDPVAV